MQTQEWGGVDSLQRLGSVLENQPGALERVACEWLVVRGRDGRPQPLLANAAQREFERRCGRENIVLKARQMGMTTWIAARFLLRTMTTPGTLTLQVAHSREAAEAIFRSVQRMWLGLPAELREGSLRCSRFNVGQLVFPELDSEFRIASAADANAGRGLSVQNLHCSEVARWGGDAQATLAGLRACLAPGGELVLESTPNGASGAFYAEWNAAGGAEATATAGMVRHFLPWWLEPAYRGPRIALDEMTDEERALVQRHGLSCQQIGFRRMLERRYGRVRSQEFAEDAESCFRASGSCCFDVEAVEERLRELPQPLQQRDHGRLWQWLLPAERRQYIVAVDSAGGGEDGDFAALQVVEQRTGLQCAELQARLRPQELARAAVQLAREYNQALIAVERNNHGSAVLAYLDTAERYTNLYRQRGEAGWLTSAASKPEILARLDTLLRESPERFLSSRLLGECRTFVSQPNGGSGAAAGAHDDLLMAMAIAQAVRAERLVGRGGDV